MEKGGEETDDQIYRYSAELRNEEEARKIEVQLHQTIYVISSIYE